MGKFICAYTGEEFEDSERSVEHIVPYAIGGGNSFTLNVVSKRANSDAGRLIDAPFVSNWFIATQIFMLGITNHNGEKPQLKWLNSETDIAGTKYGLSAFYSENGWEFLIKDNKRSRKDPKTETTQVSYLIKPEEASEFLDKVQERYRRKGIPAEFSIGETICEENPSIHTKISFNLFDLEKEFIKIALGVAVHRLGTDFIETDEAALLRKGMWAESRNKAAKVKIHGNIWPDFNDETMTKIFRNKEHHIIALINLGDRIACYMLLFGVFPGIVQVTHRVEVYGCRIGSGVVIDIDPINRTYAEFDYLRYVASRLEMPNGQD